MTVDPNLKSYDSSLRRRGWVLRRRGLNLLCRIAEHVSNGSSRTIQTIDLDALERLLDLRQVVHDGCASGEAKNECLHVSSF
jgi:hypothetical protein